MLARALFSPVNIAPLVLVRVAFGALMTFEALYYLGKGWVRTHYVEPAFLFKYYGFGWIHPWPGDGMYWHFVALAILAVCMMLGLAYRVAAVLFFLGFSYVFLLERADFLNHHYLICLLAFILIFVPAHRAFSLDASLRPHHRSSVAPAWALWWLRFQIAVPYVFGGIAKFQGDWLRGEPMRAYLEARPLLGGLFREPWMAVAMSWGGLLLDLLIVPALLWRRTRVVALLLALVFHLMNSQLFEIGVFPWLMIGASLVFFPPESLDPRRWFGARPAPSPSTVPRRLDRRQHALVALLAAWVVVQLLIPLRPLWYPGNSLWTEEGTLFSWQMMLRRKLSGGVFLMTDPARGETWIASPLRYLTRRQKRLMLSRPDMILQFAHFLAREMHREGRGDVEVRARIWGSLNGRPLQPLVDERVDLAREPQTLAPARWIVPLSS